MGERKIEHQAITANRAQGQTPSGTELALVAPLALSDGGLPRLEEIKEIEKAKDLLESMKKNPAPLADGPHGYHGESVYEPSLGRVTK